MSDEKRIKILTISDHPLAVSGVANQTKIIIESWLKSGKFDVISLAGAIKHQDYSPSKTTEWEDRFIIIPVDDFGSPEIVRTILRTEKPDILFIMSDPRFYFWFFEMAHEIRQQVPIVWNCIWDGCPPAPLFNAPMYESCDQLVCISKNTYRVNSEVIQQIPEDRRPLITRQPHSVDPDLFCRLSEGIVKKFKRENLHVPEDKFVVGMVNRNARRKHPATLILWFKHFLDIVGHDKATLVLHMKPQDQEGYNLPTILKDWGMDAGQVMISPQVATPEQMVLLTNTFDVAVNISDAEGFGLNIIEALSCEVPVLVNMTGGLTEQVSDDEGHFFGVGIKPRSQYIVGSMVVPYCMEDRITEEEFIEGLIKLYKMPKEERRALGTAGREHVLKNMNFKELQEHWVKIMLDMHEHFGSWKTRKNYNPYHLVTL